MQTPSQTIPLELSPADDRSQSGLQKWESLQRIVRFDLKEEGNHVLTVNVNYSETAISKDNSAASGRARNFRKLYQFIAQPCLGVRTKVSNLPAIEVSNDAELSPMKIKLLRYVLEAQLENMTDGFICLERVTMNAQPPFESRSMNWDEAPEGTAKVELPKLGPQDIWQVAFVLQERQDDTEARETVRDSLASDGRAVLGQLSIQWRSAMGEPGFLSTGALTTRRR